MTEPRDYLDDAGATTDVIAGGGADFGAFAIAQWPALARLGYELTGDRDTAADLAQTALARTSLAWWRVSRTAAPQDYARRVLIRAGGRVRPRPGGTASGFGPAAQVRLDQIELRAKRMRSRRALFAGIPVLAGVVAAAIVLVPASRPAARSDAPARIAPSARGVSVTNGVARPGPGVFASGTANGKQWQLVAENIADPGFGCVPAVSVDGNDADPLYADPHPLAQSPVGDPAFVTLGTGLPGAGFAFIQVPADADWLWADPAGTFQLGVAPVTVTVCGRQFRLAGFAYPLAMTLRLHLSFRDRAGGTYTVPAVLSAPRGSADTPQVDGMWQSPGPAHGPVAAGTIAAGNLFGEHWSIRVTFGAGGDCFSLSTSPPAGSTADGLWQAGCGPISTPQGPSTIMVLPLGSPHPGVVGVGYAVSVGAGVDHLTAELSDGSNLSARPLVVGGRKYAAFFVPGQLRLFWLNWVNAAGRPIAGTTGLPDYGFMQFSPVGVPVLKAESWSYGGIN